MMGKAQVWASDSSGFEAQTCYLRWSVILGNLLKTREHFFFFLIYKMAIITSTS